MVQGNSDHDQYIDRLLTNAVVFRIPRSRLLSDGDDLEYHRRSFTAEAENQL